MPRGLEANLRLRHDVISFANEHGDDAIRLLWRLCAENFLFYVNVFAWTYDPRKVDDPAIPFIPYEYQDKPLIDLHAGLGKEDMLVIKSRDMGATWMCLMALEHKWHFKPLQSFLVASRKEVLVDSPDNPDCLFYKIDFLHKRMPGWMLPQTSRKKLSYLNEGNGSTLDGESTTGDLGRGGRRTAILLDEFAAVERPDGYRVLASTRDVTRSRIFNSTPQGSANAYADMAQLDTIYRIELHWSLHPEKNPGLYTSQQKGNGMELVILDHNFKFPPDYKFILDSKKRSPWYDGECKRTPIPSQIAQELDMDFVSSGSRFFDETVVSMHMERFAVEPTHAGDLTFDRDSHKQVEFAHNKYGLLKLWCNLKPNGKPDPVKHYVLAADISVGTGASNSVIVVANRATGQKVAEFVDSATRPEKLASYAVALAYFFGDEEQDPIIAWEANGPGQAFGNAVLDTGYTRVWYRPEDRMASASGKTMKKRIPGFWTHRQTKREFLTSYHLALARGDYVNRSKAALEECRDYVNSGGGVEHARSIRAADDADNRDNHGDRVIADAVCWHVLEEYQTTPGAAKGPVPANSYAGRRKVHGAKVKRINEWADDAPGDALVFNQPHGELW